MIHQLMHNILIGSLASSTASIFLILFRRIIIKYIGAIWNYYIWFTVFISWFAIWLPLNFSSSTSLKVKTIIKPLNALISNSTIKFDISFSTFFLIIWLSGVFICLSYILINHLLFSSKLKINSWLISDKERESIKAFIANNDYKYLSRIYVSKSILSPMLCQFINSKIFIPDNFFRHYSAIEQKYVIKHELVHLKRCDLLSNAAMILLGCLNWFNPIMFYTYRYFRDAQELACDAVISERLSPNEKKDYGYALLKTVINQNSQLPVLSCGWNTQKQLKERYQMLKFHHLKPIRIFIGGSLLITAVCTAVAAPNFEKRELHSAHSKIMFSANLMMPSSNKQQTILKGNVDLSINNRIKITADNVLVIYENKGVAEFIIYGNGTLKEDGHKIQFTNGTFNPNTSQLSAEKIDRKS